jgi:hypothetical protein
MMRSPPLEDHGMSQPAAIPLVKDTEQRLAKMCRQLEDMFRSLELVYDEISVCSEAARSQGRPELASVLGLCVCDRLFTQLKSLTHIVEWLGGKTKLSGEFHSLEKAMQDGETKS